MAETQGGGDKADPGLVRSRRWERAEIQKAVEAGSSRAKWDKADPSLVRSKQGGRGNAMAETQRGGGPGGLRKQEAVWRSGIRPIGSIYVHYGGTWRRERMLEAMLPIRAW